MIQIIVSRYNEDIEWTKQFENVIIYNKGEKLNLPNEIMLENVGREGHTYYKHIIDNYDNLPDYCIFLQGNPFDHSPNIIQNIQNFINNPNDINFVYLSEYIYITSLYCCPYKHIPNFLHDYNYIFNTNRTENLNILFGAGAQFIVSKNNILNNNKELYERIVKLLSYSSDPIEGHSVERLHCLILNNN